MDEQPRQDNGSAPPPPPQPKAGISNRSRNFSRRMASRRSAANPVFKFFSRIFGLIGLIIGSLFRLAARVFRGAGRREFRHLLQGLPALFMFAGVVYASMQVSIHRAEFLPSYKRLAYDSSQAQKFDEALLYFRKLMKLDGGSADSRYLYARTLDDYGNKFLSDAEQCRSEDPEKAEVLVKQGQSRKLDALATIQQLAPINGQGYPQAHLYVAKIMLANPKEYIVDKNGDVIPERADIVRHHLSSAGKTLSGTIELEMAYFAFHMGMKEIKEAVDHLEALAAEKPHLHFDVMRLHARMGNVEKAEISLQLALAYYKQLVEVNPDNQIARARYGNLLLNNGDSEEAVKVLEQGLVRAGTENNPFATMLAQANVAIYDEMTKAGTAPIETRLAHIRQALSYVTDFRPALSRLAQLVSQPGDAGKNVETMINRMIAEGRMPATGHFALGTKAWQEKDLDKALWHLERAYELDPALGHIGNNLAWMLAEQDPPELGRALQIIDSVLKKFPNIATFHDTKGYILIKREEWDEALTELELALPSMRDNIETHKSLAIVYRQLDRPELADEHEAIIQRLMDAKQAEKERREALPFNPNLLPNPTIVPDEEPNAAKPDEEPTPQ